MKLVVVNHALSIEWADGTGTRVVGLCQCGGFRTGTFETIDTPLSTITALFKNHRDGSSV